MPISVDLPSTDECDDRSPTVSPDGLVVEDFSDAPAEVPPAVPLE